MRSALAIYLLVLTSCIRFSDKGQTYTSKSPDGRSELRVEEFNCSFADCAIRTTLKHGSIRYASLGERGDCAFNFAHVAWTQSQVAVFVDGGWCGVIKSAFDFSEWRYLNFADAETWLRQSIIHSYSVTPEELAANGGDVFKWAAYPGDGKPRRSVQEFQKRLANSPQ